MRTRRGRRQPAAAERGDWYDYPQYFDLGFASETPAEADFVEAAYRIYGRPRRTTNGRRAENTHRRLLDLGCGGGRLVVEMARRGWQATGLDNNPRSAQYAQRRIARRRLPATVLLADMADFRLSRRIDAATCTFDTFRHLTSERSAAAHLRCVARALRPGGVYILGLHLLPPDAAEECCERWWAARGATRVSCTLRVLETNRRARIERLRTTMLVRRPGQSFRVATEFPLRMYTARQFRQLLAKAPELELCATFDFWYDIDEPLPLNDDNSDCVFVLRRKRLNA